MDFSSMQVGYQVLPETLSPQMLVGGLIILAIIIILKGMALYKAARLKEKGWFWIILLVNTSGILPVIYLYIKRGKKI